MTDEQALESPGPKNVAAEFAKHHYCKTRGNNLIAAQWQDGSNPLFLKAGVYSTSDCGSQAGFTFGYLIETATGEIARQYTPKQIDETARGCPSTLFPKAFASQQDVDTALKGNKVQK